MENKFAPCTEKKCSVCCDPVKVARFFPDDKIPLDSNGEKIWVQRKGLLAPFSHIDTERLKTFDCKKFDKATGRCVEYDSRPDICRNTSYGRLCNRLDRPVKMCRIILGYLDQ